MTKERTAKMGHKTDTSVEPKNLTRSLIGKCTALYVVNNAKLKKRIKDVKYCQLIVPF